MKNELVQMESQEFGISGFSAENLLGLQIKLWDLLAERTARYTAGDSSSVPTETAQELLHSICYTLGLDLNGSPAVLMEFLHADLEERYKLGISEIECKIDRGKALWKEACLSLPLIENISLRDTLKSIGGFWKRYHYRFFAHVISCDIDYPLCHPVPETLQGVDYVNEYLQRILIEQDLLCRLDAERSQKLLEQYCGDYQGLLINLYEPIATNAIGLAMVGGNIFRLSLSKSELEQMRAMLESLTKEQSLALLLDAAETVCTVLEIRHDEARRYLRMLSKELYPRIGAALPYGSLGGVFLSFDGI